MKKVFNILISITASILTIGLVLGFPAYFLLLHHYKGRKVVNEWHSTDTFDIDKIPTLTKQKDKDFIILNLADVQMCDLEDLGHAKIIHKEITYLVDLVKPDLITLTGDQVWSNENLISLKSLIYWLDEYQIPYAPVFGNHDFGNKYDSATSGVTYSCDLYEKGKYSLFDRGPTNIGTLGNYVINIKEDDKIINSLYMMDYGWRDEITDEQVEWFKWNADGIKAHNNNEYSKGMVFMHKPIHEFFSAIIYEGEDQSDADNYSEPIFAEAKTHGVTDFVCGHFHELNFSLKFQDIRMTMATKTGELVGFYEDNDEYINGGTSFALTGDDVIVTHNYVNRNDYRIKR